MSKIQIFKKHYASWCCVAYDRLKIISGNGNLPLAEAVAHELGMTLVNRVCDHFPDGETKITINDSVRGDDVYIIQSTAPGKTNNDYMELFFLAEAMKRCGARRRTWIAPYCGYTRQDRPAGRQPLSMWVIAEFCKKMGIDRYVFIDLHNAALQSLFGDSETVMDLSSKYLFAKELKTRPGFEEYIVGSPDSGGVKRADELATILGLPLVYVHKKRDDALNPKAKKVVGDVKDKTVVLVDDITATAGTLGEGVKAFKAEGAQKIIMCVSHALLAGNAVDNINASGLDELIMTDTLSLSDEKKKKFEIKVTQLSWAERLAKLVIVPLYTDRPTTRAFEE